MEIDITVAYATPEAQLEIPLAVKPSCTVILAIQKSGLLQQFPELKVADLVVGVNSRKVPLDALVRVNDRIEIYRPLQIDPKQARRLRARKSGFHNGADNAA